MTTSRPALVAVSREGEQAYELIEALMSQVRRRLPGVEVRTSYTEGLEPSVGDALAEVGGRSVVVPLVLEGGTYAGGVVPLLARSAGVPVRVSRPLGPHPLIAAVMCERLQAAGARRGDAVALVAESSDSETVVDSFTAAKLLQSRWGAPVRVAHLAGNGDRLTTVVDRLWQEGHRRIAAAPYLLATGDGAQKARTQASLAGCLGAADVLGNHRLMAELVVRRYVAAAEARRDTVPMQPAPAAARVA